MAAVSANIIHHQQQSGHAKVSQDDQSDEESNDGSLHSATREKHSVVSSPEYKASSPEKTLMNSFSSKSSDNTSKYVCTPKESGGRSPSGYDGPSDTPNSHTQFNSSFSMHNVLKMKSERDSVSPSPIHCSNAGVFSTAKLLKNTPNYITKRPEVEMNAKNDESSCDASPKRRHEEEMDYRESDYNLRSSSPMESEEKSSRLDTSNLDEGNSCCSEGTVLSVGNEAQINSFDTENRTCSTANSTAMSPRSSPTPSPASSNTGNLQHLSSFKHIQSHLSAISQLNQSLHGSQHMLLRPNPITPNPLMFLNHNRLLFNPHLQIQGNVTPIEILHQSPRSLSNSPTSVNPALSTRLSPNDLSPTPSSNSHHLSPSPPEFEAKVNLVQNIPGFAGLPSHIGQSLRFYKQNPFPAPTLVNMPPSVQALNDHFNKKIFQEDKMESRKMHMKVLNLDKIGTMNNNSHSFNPGGVNERLLASNNQLSNNPNVTNNNPDLLDERHNIIINHNGLKFSIDNILKADFGRRITDPLHKRSKSSSSKHKFGGLLNPLSLAENSNKQVPLQHHNISETFGSSAFKKSAFQASKESESFFGQSKSCGPSNSFIQNSSLNSSSSSSGSSRVSSERLSTESRIPSGSELKSVTSLQNNLVSSSVGGGGGAEAQAAAAANPMDLSKADSDSSAKGDGPMVWPAWVYCTRYSDRPSSGRSPRTRKPKKQPGEVAMVRDEEKRPRTAFSGPQLARLKHEFAENRYLTERRRQQLSAELGLNEAQIKIWFQNKRAKIKKASGQKNPLALQLMAQGLYNHSTVPLTKEEEELQELHARETREAKA